MKRFLGVLLVIVMLTVPALAEELDLSAMSTDELIALSNRVASELKTRVASNGDEIAEGTYVVGRDIKSGTYEFTCTSIRDGASDYYGASVFVFPDENSLNDMNNIIQAGEHLKVDDVIAINLADGMVFCITYCSGQLVAPERSWTAK